MDYKWTFNKVLLLVTLSLAFFLGLQRLDLVMQFVSGGVSLFTPLILGFCIAFIVNVLMVPIEKLITNKYLIKGRRAIALFISLIVVFIVFFVLLILIIPAFSEAIQDIITALPGYWQSMQTWLTKQTDNLPFDIELLPNLDIDWKALSSWAGKFLSVGSSTVVNATIGVTTTVLGLALNLLLGLVFAIYGLMQKEALASQFTRLLQACLSANRVKFIIETARLTERIFSNFIRGQLTESLVIGGLCFVGMLVLDIPHALVVSALVGATALIPVFGAIIGTVLGVFLIVMVSPIKALWFIIFIIVLQQLESNLIYPKVVGDSIGLPGIWVLAAVTLGAGTFGILGMLIGVPLSSVIYALTKQWVNTRLKHSKKNK